MKEIPLVFPFKTLENYYFYDTNRNAIAKINQELYLLIEEVLNRKIAIRDLSRESQQKLDRLRQQGFLSNNRVQVIEHPATRFLGDIVQNKLQTITLQVTQQCNLRCNYCIYSGSYITRKHSEKIMSFEMAKKGIDFLLKNSANSNILNVGFYGGEPLLEYDLVKNCIYYAKEKSCGKKINFSITTNATLLTKDMVEFFAENHVNLMISLDGPKEIHDLNRRFAINGMGTFDVIVKKMEMIRNRFPDYYEKINFNAVIDPKVNFSCLNEFLSNYTLLKDSFISTNFISTDNIDEKDAEKLELLDIKYREKYNYEIFKAYLSKLKRLDEEHTSKIALSRLETIEVALNSLKMITNKLPEKTHHGGVCIPGVRKLFMDVSGTLYPCEKCSETSSDMKIGTIEEGFDLEQIEKLLNIGKFSEEKCKNCWAIRLCGICAVSMDDGEHLSKKKKLERCNSILLNTEEMLKEYCMLNEFGYHFEKRSEKLFQI